MPRGLSDDPTDLASILTPFEAVPSSSGGIADHNIRHFKLPQLPSGFGTPESSVLSASSTLHFRFTSTQITGRSPTGYQTCSTLTTRAPFLCHLQGGRWLAQATASLCAIVPG